MSQDPYSVRRETLGRINYNSAIPQPASALKRSSSIGANGGPRSSGPRLSLAQTRPNQAIFQTARSSSGTNLPEMSNMSAVKRSSFANNSGRKSFAPQSLGGGRDSNERRSSVYRSATSAGGPGLHQSFFQQAPAAAGVPRDPRPLKDRAYQAKIGQELLDYLANNNFEMEMKHMLSQNTIRSPTQKDFNFMFQWLYHKIDPSYRFLKNIDQEVPPILKQLRYPFERSITKSQISAVGGQNWSTFLGMLHWMMQLAQMLDGYSQNKYDDACMEAGVDVSGDRIIFDFLRGAYSEWLQMDDEADQDDQDRVLAPYVENMARQFDEANSKYEDQLQMLEAEHKKLRDEIEEIAKTTPDIESLDKNFKILQDDKIKFEGYDEKMGQKCERYEQRVQFLQEEIEKAVAELGEAEEERNNLQRMVDDQGISMQDIDRMTTERERLQKGIEATSARLEEAKKKVNEKGREAERKLDELERLVDNYNSLGYQIGIIPETAANAKGRTYELQVLVNQGPNFSDSRMGSTPPEGDRLLADPNSGYQPHQLLNLDLREARNSLIALKKEVSDRRIAAVETMMKNRDLLDGIKEAIEDKRSEVDALEHKVRAAQEEFEKTKEITNTQKISSDTQIEKMEKEVAKVRAGLTEDSILLMEQREIHTEMEYSQLKLRSEALREDLHSEVERMLQDIIKFKVHVSKNLEDYESIVCDEVNQELDHVPDEMDSELVD